jgi:hypothetical protein
MRCAVEHDFGASSTTMVVEASSSPHAATRGLTADELRLKVVARALEKSLAELKVKASEVEVQLCGVVSLSAAPLSEINCAGLVEELARLRGPAVAEVKACFEMMARPGVVMGEDELQALADVRGACVEVRSLVCVRESSDWGEMLSAKIYVPSSDATTQHGGREKNSFSNEGALSSLGAAGKDTGKGGTLVLLQEARSHRMSHFQLLRLSRPSLPPRLAPREQSRFSFALAK